MPRKPRFFLPSIPAHVCQRGNNRQPVFFAENDYRLYLDLVATAAIRHNCRVRAHVLMTNHIHLLVTPSDTAEISDMMQWIERQYVPYVNHDYRRSGTLWEGRFKAHPVQDAVYLLNLLALH